MEATPEDHSPRIHRGASLLTDRLSSRVSNDFPKKNTKLAFEESVRAITSLYEGVWHDEQEVLVENVLGLTMEVSFPTPL